MQTNIFMIRHAESPFIFGKERIRPLSEKGVKDAKKLNEIIQDIKFDSILSSPYKRALQTVEYATNSSNIKICEGLKERPIKGNYKLPKEEVEQAIKRSFIDIDFCLEGGETVREAQFRSLPIIFNILQDLELKNVAIGTHGNIMTSIMNYFEKDKYNYNFWKSTTKPDIYKLTFKGFSMLSSERIYKD